MAEGFEDAKAELPFESSQRKLQKELMKEAKDKRKLLWQDVLMIPGNQATESQRKGS